MPAGPSHTAGLLACLHGVLAFEPSATLEGLMQAEVAALKQAESKHKGLAAQLESGKPCVLGVCMCPSRDGLPVAQISSCCCWSSTSGSR